jgi:uncharacterized protein
MGFWKGFSHFRANGIDPEEIVGTRLFPDMHPFRFPIQSLAYRSLSTIEAIRSGVLQFPVR